MKKAVVYVREDAFAEQVRSILVQDMNLQVQVAGSEPDVLACLDETTVVLTDLLVPQGLGLLKTIRSAENGKSSAPVVVLTSPANEQVAVQALRDGASSYVPNRLLDAELLRTLDSVYAVAHADKDRSRIYDCMTRWDSEFYLPSDRSLVSPLVKFLQAATRRMGLLREPGEALRLGTALEEALLNATYHGNLEVSSALREEDDTAFYALVEQRRFTSPYAERRTRIQVEITPQQAEFIITDQGPGFDVSKVPDPTDPKNVERVCGRGMLLMRTFMDEVEYNEQGNRVRMVKRGQPVDSSTRADEAVR